MALKDMKSDLSKFRVPKTTPLDSKPKVQVNKNLNKTPLSGLVKDAPIKTSISPTVAKDGVNPKKINQTEKFKGETTPKPMDNSEKFKGETTPKPMSLEERYLGQTDPKLVNQTEKFKGETNPKEMDNSSKFLGETSPKESDKSSKFLGETKPSEMDNSSKFLGETSPKEANNQTQFLGETSPKESDKSSKFLGETTPKEANNQSQFLGETTPKEANNKTQFLGETTPKEANNKTQFLGETTPKESDRSSKFLGETNPKPMSLEERFLGQTTPNEMPKQNGESFLGETTPNESDRSSKFLGETNPKESDKSSKFLGETSPSPMNIPNGEKGLGETSPSPMNIPNGEKGLGETTPTDFSFKKKLENEGKDFKEVNNLLDIHSTGFNSKFGGVEATRFVGVNPNNTVFDGASSLFSNTSDNTFTLGKTYGKSFNDAGGMNSGEEGFGIGKGQAKRKSPSFLDEQYNKFNLRDDAFNLGTAAFAHPLILRGIQRKGLSKGEPQKWGFGFPIDDGLVRGGIVTAVDRAVVDAVRLGKWMISVKGLLWGVKNLGLQASNPNVESTTGKRLTKVWTPINTIASALGGFVGLHPRRHGILPLPEAVGPEKYEFVQKAKKVAQVDDITLGVPLTGNRLVGLYNESFFTAGGTTTSSTFTGAPFLRLQSPGGPNSLYGLIPGGKIPHRDEDTRFDVFNGFTIQKQYNVVGTDPSTGPTSAQNLNVLPFDRDKTPLGKEIKDSTDEYKPIFSTEGPNKGSDDSTKNGKAGRIYNDEETYPTLDTDREEINGIGLENIYNSVKDGNGLDETNEVHTKYDNPFEKLKNTDGQSHNIELLDSSELIKGYETIAYGNIPSRVANDTENNDFRSLLTGDEKKRADKANYSRKNITTAFGFTNPGKVGADRTDYNTSHAADPIQSGAIGGESDDLVKLIFDIHGGGSKLQFRGAVSGITETFSPGWDGMKYNGRADSAFMYKTFERSLSFNFQVYPTSKAELIPLYKKLERLSTMTMPNYGSAGYEGILLDFTLGKLWVSQLSFIDSLSYSFSDDVPWDIDEGASMGIDVSVGLKLLMNELPKYQTNVYNLNGM